MKEDIQLSIENSIINPLFDSNQKLRDIIVEKIFLTAKDM
jgi:hypothetical protein